MNSPFRSTSEPSQGQVLAHAVGFVAMFSVASYAISIRATACFDQIFHPNTVSCDFHPAVRFGIEVNTPKTMLLELL